MKQSARPDGPGQELPRGSTLLHAKPGDTLIIDDDGATGMPRTGTIVDVPSQDGAPPYLVHWTAGDYLSHVSPGPGAYIERHR